MIHLPEAILMLLIVVPVDILEAIANFTVAIPILGKIFIVIMWLADPICLFFIGIWLKIKGVKWAWYLVGSILEFIPGIDILPLRTVTLLLTIYLANNPEVVAVAKIAKPIMKK